MRHRDPKTAAAAKGFLALAVLSWLASLVNLSFWLACVCLFLSAIAVCQWLVGTPENKPATPVPANDTVRSNHE